MTEQDRKRFNEIKAWFDEGWPERISERMNVKFLLTALEQAWGDLTVVKNNNVYLNHEYAKLEDENAALRKQVAELQQQLREKSGFLE